MRFLGVVIWSFILGTLLAYVLTSMSGDVFAFGPVIVLTVAFSIIVTIVGDFIIPPDTHETVE
ncbi:DUF2929 family protein [Paraliobacillus sediminis]|uniref:DUF2929 family protein n=1 Tax=Paraliobacillus sediminis TaxID=1885916 RepID=UPI000E3B64A7|nr:DUF2929 family protein [Paraliobacillus sediminis]